MKAASILYWVVRLTVALLLLQTLYFKFSGAEESIYIFTTVGMEPWGRILVGILELVAAILLLINPTAWVGAGLALALMCGAILMHLTLLGIVVNEDGGLLFIYALIVVLCSAMILVYNKKKVAILTVGIFRRYR